MEAYTRTGMTHSHWCRNRTGQLPGGHAPCTLINWGRGVDVGDEGGGGLLTTTQFTWGIARTCGATAPIPTPLSEGIDGVVEEKKISWNS